MPSFSARAFCVGSPAFDRNRLMFLPNAMAPDYNGSGSRRSCGGGPAPARLSKRAGKADKERKGDRNDEMHYNRAGSTGAGGDLANALKRIRRRLAGKRWEMDGSGRIRCEILPPAVGHPRRVCCPLGMLAADASHARLDRVLRERANTEWRAMVETYVEMELRTRTDALRQQPDRLHRKEHAEQNLVRLGIGLAVTTMPSNQASESILAMAPGTVQLLSEAADHPDTQAGILLTRALRAESNTLAEDFRTHYRQSVDRAALAFRAASAVQRRRLRSVGIDDHDANERGTTGRGFPGGSGLPAAAIRFGAGLWSMVRANPRKRKESSRPG